MELLYVWINYSKNGILKEQGLNFSPEFDFHVRKEEENWVLTENTDWHGKRSVFRSDVIENVTAIVGKNGTGKTTLLDFLANLDCSVPYRGAYPDGYAFLRERETREALCVLILREGETITVYHDFDAMHAMNSPGDCFECGFVNRTPYAVKDMSDAENYRQCLTEQSDFRDICRVYITNSSYGGLQTDTIEQQGKIVKVSLTPSGLSTIAGKFYNKLLDLGQAMYVPERYREWREIVRAWKKLSSFQQICDVVYFQKLFREGTFERYSGHISAVLSLNCVAAGRLLDEKYPQFHDKRYKETFQENPFYELYLALGEMYAQFQCPESIIIRNVTVNLLVEMCLAGNLAFPKEKRNVEECLAWAKQAMRGLAEEQYFREAVKEIRSLQELLENAESYSNVVPETDLAYHREAVFDYHVNPELYVKFLDYISDCFAAERSMVLRYLEIGNLKMSSGERAFQNFFSWLNLLPQFHKIDAAVPEELRGTVLLLIDEIDLYLHPAWQKDFISLLLKELEQQFSGYKVQVVFATHSPLCLSDVPKENTIYLSGEPGGTRVDERMAHGQTFGKDIYSLLNDAFFLENSTMGSFAKEYIDKIIRKMLDENGVYRSLSAEEAEELAEEIRYIGDDLLRNKLLSMLPNCLQDRNEEMELLRKYQREIELRLEVLENR